MKATELLSPTLREEPSEAEIPSHRMLLKAGMIKKEAAGIYTYLPLAYKVIKKIMNIIRKEMDRAGGQELLLPIVQPAELWQESGRWDVYGEEMFRLKDRHDRSFCLGPTHEEIITALVRSEVSSYKQLPLLLYQMQNKYRDEKRPRFGLMRGREFIMKDLYSFDVSEEGMKVSYDKMHEAYSNVFSRCGLDYKVVEADTGAIGGNASHEFMVMADSGEAEIVFCKACDYASNVEKAECKPEKIKDQNGEQKEKEMVYTPQMKTIEQVAEYLNVSTKETLKSLIYEADGELVCVLLRGDRQINEVKLNNALDCINLKLADEEKIAEAGLVNGFVGPVDLEGIKILADLEVREMPCAVVGANKKDYHYKDIRPEKDIKFSSCLDLRQIEEGESCPKCGSVLQKKKGIEVGQIFQLGTKYSEALNATYTDENGTNNHIVMGCYGIGVTRTMAAAIEQNYDKDGIKWPLALAPFEVVVIPVSSKDDKMMQAAEKLYSELKGSNIEVILDDREERAGVKFKDADLIGYPYRITVGKKTIEDNTVDVKDRQSGEEKTLEINKAFNYIKELISV